MISSHASHPFAPDRISTLRDYVLGMLTFADFCLGSLWIATVQKYWISNVHYPKTEKVSRQQM
jgi:hypothetical protein